MSNRKIKVTLTYYNGMKISFYSTIEESNWRGVGDLHEKVAYARKEEYVFFKVEDIGRVQTFATKDLIRIDCLEEEVFAFNKFVENADPES